MAVAPRDVVLPAEVRLALEKWVRACKTDQALVERSRILLLSADGTPNMEQAAALGVDVQRVRRWRNRWCDAQEDIAAAVAAGVTQKELLVRLRDALGDAARSGRPVEFSPKQVAAIIQLACEDHQDSGLPLSHWTPPRLAQEAARRGIVEKISPRHVDRLLKSRRPPAASDALLAQSKDR